MASGGSRIDPARRARLQRRALSAFPFWCALLGKGMGALARVVGALEPKIEFAFELEAVGERHIQAAQGGLFDALDAERRALADFGGDLLAFANQFAHRDDIIDESETESLVGADTVAGVEHLQGAAERDETRQTLSAAAAGEPAETNFAETELGVRGGDADIACEGLLEAAAVGVAVNRR